MRRVCAHLLAAGLLLWLVAVGLAAALPVDPPPAPIPRNATFRVAAVQIQPVGREDWRNATRVLQANLDAFRGALAEACEGGARVVVFPEAGLGWIFAEAFNNTKAGMSAYCDEMTWADYARVPTTPAPCSATDPPQSRMPALSAPHPCTEGSTRVGWMQLSALSCMAQQQGVLLVANMCLRVGPAGPAALSEASTADPACARAGQYNTNVVFNETGHLIALYHKYHLFGGGAVFDRPHRPTPVVVESAALGVRFGTFVCFDLEFAQPATALEEQGVRHILFTSWWVDAPPFHTALQFQQAFSRLHCAVVVAANTASPSGAGGGVFACGRVLASHFDPFEPPGRPHRVILADVPYDPPVRHEELSRQARCIGGGDRSAPAGIADVPAAGRPVVAGVEEHPHATALPPSPIAPPHTLTRCNLQFGFVGDCAVFALPAASPAAPYVLAVAAGNVQCRLRFTVAGPPAADPPSPPQVLALVAIKDTFTFPNTPDPLQVESCALVTCGSGSGSGGVSGRVDCQPAWLSTAWFADLRLDATGLSRGQALPLIAASRAVLLQPEWFSVQVRACEADGPRSMAMSLQTTAAPPLPLWSVCVYVVLG